MSFRRRTSGIISRVALATMLLAVQVTAAGHIDFDGHSQETQCAICVSASTLDAVDVSSQTLRVAGVPAKTLYLERAIFVTANSNGRTRARAPPIAS